MTLPLTPTQQETRVQPDDELIAQLQALRIGVCAPARNSKSTLGLDPHPQGCWVHIHDLRALLAERTENDARVNRLLVRILMQVDEGKGQFYPDLGLLYDIRKEMERTLEAAVIDHRTVSRPPEPKT